MRTRSLRTSVIAGLLAMISISTNATPRLSQCLAQPVAGNERASRAISASTYKLSPSKDVVMNLAGTSTVKDWSMKAHSLRGEAKMVVTEDNQLMEIPALNFSLPVHNLKGEERLMDEDAYKALKADEYRDIVFTLTSAGLEARGDRHYLIRALGTLSVAGVTKVVNMKMHAQLMPDGTITVVGAEHLKMSDYNVERPSHLFGIVKAGDDMTLTYTLIFTK